jgi:hypothetical protein
MANMDKPNIFNINNEEYYNANDLKKYDPAYFYGCNKIVRKIVNNKSIPTEDYTYATFNINGKVWRTYENNIPSKAGLYIKKNWVIEHVTKMKDIQPVAKKITKINSATKKVKKTTVIEKQGDKKTIDDTIDEISNEKKHALEYQEAPELLILKDDEKFKDDNGNVIEIEIRGERTCDGIFFLLTHIAKVFDLPNIRQTMMNDNSDYYVNEHYLILIRLNDGMLRKSLFITLKGFQKILSNSRSEMCNKNEMILIQWISKIFPRYNGEIVISNTNKEHNQLMNAICIVYVITSILINGAKIGFWSGTIKALKSRYFTYYGIVDLFFVYTKVPRILEKNIHDHFSEYKLSGEIFQKEHTELYKDYLRDHELVERDYVEDTSNTIDDHQDDILI